MAEEGLNVRFHFESVEALENFIDEAKVSFPGIKILGHGGTPGQGLNCMWLDILMTTEIPGRKRSLDSQIETAEKKKAPCSTKGLFRRSKGVKGRCST